MNSLLHRTFQLLRTINTSWGGLYVLCHIQFSAVVIGKISIPGDARDLVCEDTRLVFQMTTHHVERSQCTSKGSLCGFSSVLFSLRVGEKRWQYIRGEACDWQGSLTGLCKANLMGLTPVELLAHTPPPVAAERVNWQIPCPSVSALTNCWPACN